ncbi:hypothetical protein HU200_043739 [Digitaria exilis]|uniref:Uncharacterized protein n=1 Tax=Digitaria exilis TaxID=1010633 RepID=A0A835AZT4_9POAL|nr:hypothetical protein HU200_043738 [Digitaria exilis]KAF8685831.1 hypothetical protein HU200_043739 [Digitaria exilis]CAB3448643.1 unnamed protein product [Digitaria exilis]CAB3448646.1 unnamed protein product [Digitaria exilis]
MAEHQRQRAGRDELPEQPVEPADDVVLPGHHQQLCLDAGRAMVLCGVLVVVAAFHRADGSSSLALFGFVLWIVGACLCFLALTPVAPRAARVGAAAASIVLRRLSPLLS